MAEKYKTSPKDIFLQLLAIIALYGSAISLLTLFFQFINIQFPDPLEFRSLTGSFRLIRFAVSALIVVFPVYIWVLRFLNRAYEVESGRREVSIRKWLMYFTLFATGLIIMGDLVALVNSFLNGELTARFLLKVLSVFLVAGTIFWYYYWDMKDVRPPHMKLFQQVIIGIVGVSVVAAFFMVGSPQQERLRQFDEERVADLQAIQWQVVNYWQQKEKIPESLSMLEDDISGFRVPVDPQTGVPYEYGVEPGTITFNLCAEFSLPVEDIEYAKSHFPGAEDFGTNWEHGIGRTCFERTIDPDLYSIRDSNDSIKPPIPVR